MTSKKFEILDGMVCSGNSQFRDQLIVTGDLVTGDIACSGQASFVQGITVTGATSINGTVTATSFSGDGSNLTGISGVGGDADTLDGQDGAYYLDYNNFTNTPTGGGGATNLNELSDVSVSGVTNGQYLSYNSSTGQWVATSIGSEGSIPADGSVSLTSFASGLTPVQLVSTLPSVSSPDRFEGEIVFLTTNGNLYRFNDGAWTNAVPLNSVTGAGALAALNTVGSSQINNLAITNAKIAVDAIRGDVIQAGAITETKIANGSISTPKLDVGAVTANNIAAGAVTAVAIKAGEITADAIAANTITGNKIAAGAIDTDQLAAGAIIAAKIDAGAVTADKILSNSITAGQIKAGAIGVSELAANAVTANAISAGTITVDKLFANVLEDNTAFLPSPTQYTSTETPSVVRSVDLPAPTDTSVGHKVLVIAKVEWYIVSGSNWEDDGGDLPEVQFYLNKSPTTAGSPIDEWYYTHPFVNDTNADLRWFTTTLIAFDDTAVTSRQFYYLWLNLSNFSISGGNKITVQNAKITTIGIR